MGSGSVRRCSSAMLAIVLSVLAISVQGADRIACCGGPEVFIIPADTRSAATTDRVWPWQPADSPEIPSQMHKLFRTTDECKPVGDSILITASSGGVALVRLKDKKCPFYGTAKNAHSGCLIPDHRIAIASSFGGDEVLLFGLDRSGADMTPHARFALEGAHGVVWDSARQRLWALGSNELTCLDLCRAREVTEIVPERRWLLPTPGGHDLSPARDPRILFVTTNQKVYSFDIGMGEFKPHVQLLSTSEGTFPRRM